MKIVCICYLHGFGGAEKQIIMLSNIMAERGHDVTLVSISADNNSYGFNDKVRYIFLPDRKTNALRIITRYSDIKKTLSQIKPDITVNFWFQSAYMTALMKKNITGKVIYSERGDPGDKEYNGLLGLVRKFTLPRIDGFVFQTKGAQSYFDNNIQKRSVVIPNPVFIKREDYPIITERRKAIVTVGRLHPQKNHKLLIKAFALIANQLSEYSLEIYGDGELRDELQRQIDDIGLSDRILLKGTSKMIHNLIYDASLFVLCSDYEGLPNTLLEAMALGIPCISTDCKPGGARDIIDNGVDGIIVPRDNPDILSEKMLLLIKDCSLAKCFSKNSEKKSKKYNVNSIYEEWECYFRSLI